MTTFILLSQLSPEVLKSPADLQKLEKAVTDRIREECPGVRWIANYATLGPHDYVDVFEAPDEAHALKVATIIRALGHARAETWTAMPWKRFEQLIPK
jgi:uncharacterized protein with GYD domain